MYALLLEPCSFKLYLTSKSSCIYEYVISPLNLSICQSIKYISGSNVLIENLWISLFFPPWPSVIFARKGFVSWEGREGESQSSPENLSSQKTFAALCPRSETAAGLISSLQKHLNPETMVNVKASSLTSES